MNQTVRIFLCDDQAEVRDVLRHVISNLPGFGVSGEAATGPSPTSRIHST